MVHQQLKTFDLHLLSDVGEEEILNVSRCHKLTVITFALLSREFRGWCFWSRFLRCSCAALVLASSRSVEMTELSCNRIENNHNLCQVTAEHRHVLFAIFGRAAAPAINIGNIL